MDPPPKACLTKSRFLAQQTCTKNWRDLHTWDDFLAKIIADRSGQASCWVHAQKNLKNSSHMALAAILLQDWMGWYGAAGTFHFRHSSLRRPAKNMVEFRNRRRWAAAVIVFHELTRKRRRKWWIRSWISRQKSYFAFLVIYIFTVISLVRSHWTGSGYGGLKVFH